MRKKFEMSNVQNVIARPQSLMLRPKSVYISRAVQWSTFLKQNLRFRLIGLILQSISENFCNFATVSYYWGCDFFIFPWAKQVELLCFVKVKKFQKQIILSSILPKNERNNMQHFSLATRTEIFLFVFWKNWQQDNLLLKFSDL